jgi:hypothetical protein
MRHRRPSLSIVVPVPDVPEPRAAVDLKGAAGLIGVRSTRSVRRMLDRGDLEGYKPLPGKLCVYLDSIEKFQKSRKQVGQAEAANDQPGAPRPRRIVDHAQHRQACARLKRLRVL